MKRKLLNLPHIEFQQYMWKVLWYTENSIYDVMQTNVYYGPVWLKIGNDRHCLVQTFHMEFQQNLWNAEWGTWKCAFMALQKVRFIMDQ
jgi:hypothetical protein